jgi:N-methylhydantoinase A
MGVTDIRHEYVKTFYAHSQNMDIDVINDIYSDLEAEAVKTLESEGIRLENIVLKRSVDAKYPAQFYELTAGVPDGVLTKDDVPELCAAYHNVHEQKYAYCLKDSPVAFLQWRLTAIGLTKKYNRPELAYVGEDSSAAQKGTRSAYFKEKNGFIETPIYESSKLGYGMVINGPAIIETPTTNVVVYPEQILRVSKYGNYVITL